MQGSSWTSLVRRIPTKLHDTLALSLVTGAEILVQSIFRLEDEILIMRGRMAGSTDAGRVIMLPYDQVVSLAFTKRMTVAEMQAIFGEGIETIQGQAVPSADAEQESSEEEQLEAGEEAYSEDASPQGATMTLASSGISSAAKMADAPTVPAGGKTAPPSKSLLLARLRARLKEQAK